MNDASIIELLWERDEQAVSEMKKSYERLCFHVAGGILSQQEDREECVNTAYMAESSGKSEKLSLQACEECSTQYSQVQYCR